VSTIACARLLCMPDYESLLRKSGETLQHGTGGCRLRLGANQLTLPLLSFCLSVPCLRFACRRKGGKRKGTGVKYDDVAGIDHIKADVKEVRLAA